jgi:hypothetical protein
MTLIIKPLLAIFIVIFIFFIIISILNKNISSKKEKEHFDYYSKVNNFLLVLMSNPNCVSVGIKNDNQSQEVLQGVLDINKLNMYNNTNKDLWCVENFDFLFSLEIQDFHENKTWILGLNNTNQNWAERKVSQILPGVIRYNGTKINLGKIEFFAYIDDISTFYGTIKNVCNNHNPKTIKLNSKYKITYNQTLNKFFIGEKYFYPYFSCEVKDFEIPKGKSLVYLDYKDHKLIIK